MTVKLPHLGDGIENATIISILIKEGDTVDKEQTVLELETDKAVAPFNAPESGTIKSLLVKEGDTVTTGTPLFEFTGASKSTDSSPKPEKPAPETPPSPAVPAAEATPAPAQTQPVIASDSYTYTPLSGFPPPTSPSIRKMATQIGLDLNRIQGSGRGGRIELSDIRRHIAMLQAKAFQNTPQSSTSPTEKTSLPNFEKWGPIKTEKASSLRLKIGKKMQDAWQTIPHVTQFDYADITDLMALRKTYNPRYIKQGAKLTVTVFALKAILKGLKQFPIFNASFDSESGEIIYKAYYHIGIAVDTEAGLIVPVIRDVDKKSMKQLAIELTEISEKARKRTLSMNDLQGGTFTLSNLGSLGVSHFTPIINSPEVAILALSMGKKQPEFINGKIEERLILPLGLSYDHRIIDGADGARFMRTIVEEFQTFSEAALKEK